MQKGSGKKDLRKIVTGVSVTEYQTLLQLVVGLAFPLRKHFKQYFDNFLYLLPFPFLFLSLIFILFTFSSFPPFHPFPLFLLSPFPPFPISLFFFFPLLFLFSLFLILLFSSFSLSLSHSILSFCFVFSLFFSQVEKIPS